MPVCFLTEQEEQANGRRLRDPPGAGDVAGDHHGDGGGGPESCYCCLVV